MMMKKIHIQRPLLLFSLFLLLAGGMAQAQKEERKNLRTGNKLYTQEQYTEAEIAYRKSLEVNPRSVEGSYDLGNALYKQNKLPEAAEQYQLVLGQAERMLETAEGVERLAGVMHNMGNIGMQNKEYAKSIEAYKQSLRLNPYDDETRYNLALAQKLLEEQQQDQDQDQDQNEDQNEDQQDQEQNQDQNQDQDQQQDQQQDQDQEQKEDKTQEQPQQNEQMSKDNAQQMLDAFLQDEKDTQEKVKKAQAEQQQRRRTEKEW